jgi:folylpolyglutamate synthase/dihydropteroate synthase
VSAPNWKSNEYAFLEKLYQSNPTTHNIEFAKKCSDEFGRVITENSIKGAIDRLRQKGRLERKRPNRR